MKKIIIILFIIIVSIAITKKEEQILIPEESIRFRVIANSNSLEDQNKKMEVKEVVEKEMSKLMEHATNLNAARTILKTNLSNIDQLMSSQNVNYQMNYGLNHFPQKEYKGVTYSSGEYESLVITLGSGLGKNWWCVMFPPLCLLEAEENSIKDVDYQFYVKKIIDKYL